MDAPFCRLSGLEHRKIAAMEPSWTHCKCGVELHTSINNDLTPTSSNRPPRTSTPSTSTMQPLPIRSRLRPSNSAAALSHRSPTPAFSFVESITAAAAGRSNSIQQTRPKNKDTLIAKCMLKTYVAEYYLDYCAGISTRKYTKIKLYKTGHSQRLALSDRFDNHQELLSFLFDKFKIDTTGTILSNWNLVGHVNMGRGLIISQLALDPFEALTINTLRKALSIKGEPGKDFVILATYEQETNHPKDPDLDDDIFASSSPTLPPSNQDCRKRKRQNSRQATLIEGDLQSVLGSDPREPKLSKIVDEPSLIEAPQPKSNRSDSLSSLESLTTFIFRNNVGKPRELDQDAGVSLEEEWNKLEEDYTCLHDETIDETSGDEA